MKVDSGTHPNGPPYSEVRLNLTYDGEMYYGFGCAENTSQALLLACADPEHAMKKEEIFLG